MITLLQIQNFIKENYKNHIHQNLITSFDEYILKENKKVSNPLKIEFHENLNIKELEVQSILLFNQFIYEDKRLVKIFNDTPNCNLYFLDIIKNQNNNNVIDYINTNASQIINYISYKNIKLYLELSNITFDIKSKNLYPYLSYIEEYLILYHFDFYFSYILNIKEIYLSYIDYIEKKFDNKSKYELEPYYLKILKTDNIIINKYMNSLFFDKEISNLFETFSDFNNNLMIFLSIKKKYFKSFLNEFPLEFDLNVYTNYENSELFHNNNIKYFFYKD